MFVRIAGIELKWPLLQRIIEPDGGLHVCCEAPEGDCDESGAKKLLAMEGFTGLVKWKDKAGVEHEQPMRLRFAKMESKKSPDGKKITYYNFTLEEV